MTRRHHGVGKSLEPAGFIEDVGTITLGPLTDSAIATLVHRKCGDVPSRLLSRVRSVSNGNPFFALALATHPSADISAEEGLSNGVQDRILDACIPDEDEARVLLSIVAVADPIAPDDLRTLSSAATSERLSRLIAQGVVMIDVGGCVRLAHPLYRAAIYGTTPKNSVGNNSSCTPRHGEGSRASGLPPGPGGGSPLCRGSKCDRRGCFSRVGEGGAVGRREPVRGRVSADAGCQCTSPTPQG